MSSDFVFLFVGLFLIGLGYSLSYLKFKKDEKAEKAQKQITLDKIKTEDKLGIQLLEEFQDKREVSNY